MSESHSGYWAQYTYDANGNRQTRTKNGVLETYSNDDGDKLASVTWAGGSKSYTYDGAGRRKTETAGGNTTNYTWDFESRITQITKSGMATNTFAYNGLDTRVSKVDSGGTRSFKRDGAYVTDPVLSDTVSGATTNYTPGISERRTGTSRFLHSGIKNADSRTTTGTSVEATRSYDAFGNLVSSTGTWQGFFGYAGGFGYQEEPDTGLKLLGHRYYDSTTGRFLSRDPIGDDNNWYTYCGSNPMKWVDPNGLQLAQALATAGGLVLVDGPLPIGDIIALVIVIGVLATQPPQTTTYTPTMPQPSLAKDHSKNKQEKNRNRHEKGKATKKRDQGGEKGDARRNVPKPKSPPTQPPKEDPKYLRPGPKPKAAEIPGFKPGRPGSAGYWE